MYFIFESIIILAAMSVEAIASMINQLIVDENY